MKRMIIFLAFIGFYSAGSATTSTSLPVTTPPIKASELYLPVGTNGQMISLMDLSRISVRDFETLSGHKMKFSEKVGFRLGQKQLRNQINKDGTLNNKSIEKYLARPYYFAGGFSLLGAALGFFLSLIGVLIAYLLKREDKKSVVKWAWIGAIVSFIIFGSIWIF